MSNAGPSLTPATTPVSATRSSADFVGSSYLDMAHSAWELRPWDRLTSGAPAALSASSPAKELTQQLADLVGCQRATLAVSTLHLFWDLFGLLAREDIAIYIDTAAYPISQWGAERAAGSGVATQPFAHFDPEDLRGRIDDPAREHRRPLVVSDAYCPICGQAAPLADYLEIAREFGGHLLLDDSQALGVLGTSPDLATPYGRGGGGTLRWSRVEGADLLVISSLAKGFGVPLAMFAGTSEMIQWFEDGSETRVHCSAPAIVSLVAAERALTLNETTGDDLRTHLARLVEEFRALLESAGFATTGDVFPVQQLQPIPGVDPEQLHNDLSDLGVRTVLCQNHQLQPCISFNINAGHTQVDLEFAVNGLVQAVGLSIPA